MFIEVAASAALVLHLELVGKLAGPSSRSFRTTTSLVTSSTSCVKAGVMTELMKRVICYATLDGKEVKTATYDMHYNGKMMLACQVRVRL